MNLLDSCFAQFANGPSVPIAAGFWYDISSADDYFQEHNPAAVFVVKAGAQDTKLMHRFLTKVLLS